MSLMSPPLQQGGTSGFLQMFLLEAASMVTQTVTVLGGNAVVNYKVNDCMLQDSPHKNQVKICVCVLVEYPYI